MNKKMAAAAGLAIVIGAPHAAIGNSPGTTASSGQGNRGYFPPPGDVITDFANGGAPGDGLRAGGQLPGDVVDNAAVAQLVAAIGQGLAALPSDATQADMEAAIVYAIDQSNQPLSVSIAALNQIDQTRMAELPRLALNNVRATRLRVAATGTGSIAGGSDTGLAFGPTVSVSGGSSDYAAS